MTTTVQSPPPAALKPTAPAPEPGRGPRSRRWLAGFWAVVLVCFLAVQPGRMTFDTKLGVAVDPWQFLSDLGQLWHDRGGFGGIQDQYIGYAFPMLPFYALADLVQLPVWLAERLWMSLIVAVAFWGALRLAERLNIGSHGSRLLGAVVYALWPTFTVVVGSTSAAALPGAFLPWVLIPLTNARVTARIAAFRSALFIPFMGGVNAASTLASLLPVALYLLSRPNGPRKRKLITWWVPGVVLATAWWVVPLLLLGFYGENFLPYVENSATTTGTMSATETLRGAGNWVAYLHFGEAWLPAGWTVATAVVPIVCSALAAALGLAGLARRDLPERRWLVLTVVSVALVTLAGYGGAFGGPFHGTVQDWLNGGLVPFRNIYKFQTGLALALAFGLAHLVGMAARARGARPVRGRRYAPLVAAALVLPGLAWPYLNGSILQPGSFNKLPDYWDATADWLDKYSPDSRALVVPATAHGVYTWGSPIDQPLDVLADSRWAQRDYVPFGTKGNRRAMDAVENALMTGGEVPGLRDYLTRAGMYYVVVRNDLDPDQIGYVPTATVKRTLEESGFSRVTGFGPQETGGRIADDTPVQVEGLYPRQRAVEIYAPGKDAARPGQAGLKPVSNTAVVSGGPEALLPLSADPDMKDRPAVLTGDNHPGLGSPPGLQAVGDGLRRADTRFGLVNTNTSYTYTKDEKNAPDALQDGGEKPRQILPTKGVEHQTTAELRGAKSVTASSYGNWLFHLPQYDPVNAFDGNPDTAWTEGNPGSPDGEWIKAEFTKKTAVPSSFKVTPLPQQGVRSAPTKVRVETEQGSATTYLQANGTTQRVKAKAGDTSWVKLTIEDAQVATKGLTGAGFAEISIPKVQITKLLKMPSDTVGREGDDAEADATTYSMHRSADQSGLSPVTAEAGLHRKFTTTADGDYKVKASAVATPGSALDELLYKVAPDQRQQIIASADSTSGMGNGLSARNLTDGDLTTAWIAGDRPVIHLRWPGKVPVGEIVLPPAGGLSSRPEKIEISSPDGAATAGVDENGNARFTPITTDRLDITITKTAPLTLHNPVADEKLQLPVGLTEAYVPALDAYRTKQPSPSRTFELACGEGPAVSVDGKLYSSSAKGTVRDLVDRRPVELTLCDDGKKQRSVELAAGKHRVEAGDGGPLAVTDVSLTRGTPGAIESTSRELKIDDWLGDRREVTVGDGAASYLTTYENVNDGWKATLDGKELRSVRLDGWQQGWLVPAGEGGKLKLVYEPSTAYEAGLIGGGVGVLALVALVFVRRREPNPDGPDLAPPAPGLVLGTIALTLIGVVVAGWFALLVPALALLAWRRHTLLVPVAFLAMAGAGIAAATGAGEAVAADEGAFGHAAQVLAFIGLFAALVSVRGPGDGGAGVAAGVGAGGLAGAAGGQTGPGGPGGPAGPAGAGGPGGPSGPDGPGGPAGPGGPGGTPPVPPQPTGSPDATTMPLGPDRDLGAPTGAPPLPHRRRGDEGSGAEHASGPGEGPDPASGQAPASGRDFGWGGAGQPPSGAPADPGAPDTDPTQQLPPYEAGPTLSARGPDPLRKDDPAPVEDSVPGEGTTTDEGTGPGRGTRSGEDPRTGEGNAP
ncbi:alpha-(1-_3)-arabinofuranosyltransferase [Streptomyces lasiicapitis]|uniref:Coagulation factor 5/8 type n=1 Tax=Streptomyces lasiicapitis TaxID=1923961 RepID=A0ABQ2LXP9_9ACTN|nr:alpha-(1->3)-arabinofuranosyltransferase [Streptomyces lasiicapitis]GGO44413.1 coagulation factor 5/8 type [Streptomyces lasiicapitis]